MATDREVPISLNLPGGPNTPGESRAIRALNCGRVAANAHEATLRHLPKSIASAARENSSEGGISRQAVLIHGGAGGVGTMAVQLARWRGARVLATASARDTVLVRSLGADDVIDYHATRFEDTLRDIDVVLDTIGGETRERSWRVLRKGGVLVTLVSAIPADVAEQYSVRGVFFIVSGNRSQLDQITGLVDTGKLKPVLSEVLPLARAREAFEHGAAGRAPGKIVLQVAA
jgi:NADPH:quinone reductase-like Zn-dependent oxidoreductase